MDWLLPALIGFALGGLTAYSIGHAVGYDKGLNRRLDNALRRHDRARRR